MREWERRGEKRRGGERRAEERVGSHHIASHTVIRRGSPVATAPSPLLSGHASVSLPPTRDRTRCWPGGAPAWVVRDSRVWYSKRVPLSGGRRATQPRTNAPHGRSLTTATGKKREKKKMPATRGLMSRFPAGRQPGRSGGRPPRPRRAGPVILWLSPTGGQRQRRSPGDRRRLAAPALPSLSRLCLACSWPRAPLCLTGPACVPLSFPPLFRSSPLSSARAVSLYARPPSPLPLPSLPLPVLRRAPASGSPGRRKKDRVAASTRLARVE